MRVRTVVIALTVSLFATAARSALQAQVQVQEQEACRLENLKFPKKITRSDLDRLVRARALGLTDQSTDQEISEEESKIRTIESAKKAGLNSDLPYRELCKLLSELSSLEDKRALGLPDSASVEESNAAFAKYEALKSKMIQEDQEELAKIPLSNTAERDRLYFAQSARMDKLERQYVARQFGFPENSSQKDLEEFNRRKTRSMIARKYGLVDNLTIEQLCAVDLAAYRLKMRQTAIAVLQERQSISNLELHQKMVALAAILNLSPASIGGHSTIDDDIAYRAILFYAGKDFSQPIDVNNISIKPN